MFDVLKKKVFFNRGKTLAREETPPKPARCLSPAPAPTGSPPPRHAPLCRLRWPCPWHRQHCQGFCGSGLGLAGGTHMMLHPRGVLANPPARHPSEHRWAFPGGPCGQLAWSPPRGGCGWWALEPRSSALSVRLCGKTRARGKGTPQRSSGDWAAVSCAPSLPPAPSCL